MLWPLPAPRQSIAGETFDIGGLCGPPVTECGECTFIGVVDSEGVYPAGSGMFQGLTNSHHCYLRHQWTGYGLTVMDAGY